MSDEKRRHFNEQFLERLLARHPDRRADIEARLKAEQDRAVAEMPALEAARGLERPQRPARDFALETIVRAERPVLFVRDGAFDTVEVTTIGPEAVELVDRMKTSDAVLAPRLPHIGRIDVVNFPGADFVGTGWFVDTDIVVTNRHVASLIARWDGRRFAFTRGVAGLGVTSSLCNAHEFDDLDPDASRTFAVLEVLYIEPDSGKYDIAFLRVERKTGGGRLGFIPVAAADAQAETPVCVIGYPARAPKRVIPDQELMKELYRDRYDVKRAAPGFTSGMKGGSTTHDCTTLGGSSGSVVLDLKSGTAVGLHFAGLYQEDNFAVPASVLSDYIKRKRWNSPVNIETGATTQRPPAVAAGVVPSAAAASVQGLAGASSVTFPLTITVSLGAPQAVSTAGGPATPATAAPVNLARVEAALLRFWDARPDRVIAARVGFDDDGFSIGDAPFIAASVEPRNLAAVNATAPAEFEGVPVRYFPADLAEQLESVPGLESVDSIAYDDSARTGQKFSFAPVEEDMDVTLHVGPEYSWEVLEKFLSEADGPIVSAIYEFHGPHIMKALEDRLESGASLTMVVDNLTFAKVRNQSESFDRVGVFERWAERFPFERVVAPEGLSGLISDAYHIKVTVRDDDTFWLSSGNWKITSSQPIITQEQRDNAADEDLPGNREWHVVIRNRTLAERFRSHIEQDFKRSRALGGEVLPASMLEESLIEVPLEESVMLERPAPGRVLEPKTISRKVRVKPLLTPDQEGAVYSEAVLELIESSQQSLWFQIPYIGMPPNPRADRGFIDALIKALTGKLKTLADARLLLRSQGSKFSAPSHAAWFLKSKGVDIASRLKVIDDHHTKGMIVDGRRVLIGSHNWSKPGVSLNRDASLIFDDTDVASYFAEAFAIDWARARPVSPRRFVPTESSILEAPGQLPGIRVKRVALSQVSDD